MADVVYMVADKLGGIASFTANLIRYRPPSAMPQRVVTFRSEEDRDTPLKEAFGGDKESCFRYSQLDNCYTTFKRLRRAISAGPGALISNDALDLALFATCPPSRTIFQVVHDDYNFRLSQRYEPVIDVMVTHSRFYFDRLVERFPMRRNRIFYLPYGIPLSQTVRHPSVGPLRLVFVGRLHEAKGIHDLRTIDCLLRDRGVEVSWTIVGDGPERAALLKAWPESARVHYVTPASNAEVLQICAGGDVFVLPTRFEGFPVALLEAMSAGLVPVVSDLPSGIPEVVTPGSGFRLPVGDNEAFVAAIAQLSESPAMLETMSKASREQAERFDVRERAAAYHELFSKWDQFKRPWPGPLNIAHGSRLDQPWMPNTVTRTARSLARVMRCRTSHR